MYFMSIKEVLINFCDDFGLSYRTDYSGRGMFGRTCFGIVCEDDMMSTLIQLCDAIRDSEDFISAYNELGIPRTDSMGMDTILYFPSISFE